MIDKHTETRRQQSPDAAAVYCLQGKLWQGHRDVTHAIDMYAESLKLNPFMWDAFLGLCELGMFFPARIGLPIDEFQESIFASTRYSK